MSHSINIWEEIIDKRATSETFITKNQFGFILWRFTMEPIFCVRHILFESQNEPNIILINATTKNIKLRQKKTEYQLQDWQNTSTY